MNLLHFALGSDVHATLIEPLVKLAHFALFSRTMSKRGSKSGVPALLTLHGVNELGLCHVGILQGRHLLLHGFHGLGKQSKMLERWSIV